MAMGTKLCTAILTIFLLCTTFVTSFPATTHTTTIIRDVTTADANADAEIAVDISHLFVSTESVIPPTNANRDLAPTVQREARSISGSYEFGHMVPLLQTVLQLAAALPAVPPDPSRQEGADQATTQSPLTALLPLLLSGLTPGRGSVSGISGQSLPSTESLESVETRRGPAGIVALPAANPAPGLTAPATANMVAIDEARIDPNVVSTSLRNPSLRIEWKQNFDPEINCTVPRNRSAVCNDLPITRILSLKNFLVIVKDRNVYRVKANGHPIDMTPIPLDKRMDDITASVTIEGKHFVFQGGKYSKYDKDFNPSSGKYPRLVSEGFPGVPIPVNGAFQLNNHTYVFISGTKYVYFQPQANPNVDPRYSPQYLDNVPGAPPTVDSVFTIKNKRFLHRRGTIFEMASDQMKVEREFPVYSSTKQGWLKCPDLFPPECGGAGRHEAHAGATEIP
ncbi:uncharacterized protein LOC129593619 [Paramacrobiotus metropolitanus]|uniref:uncharacterized protein LOC129593619 n=1 Tax=Paramacrobiotus metropolitanus TaxID=2943436 RepID=UPI002445E424|nr:uncharacterized protein LOC129593619 [Paramacrobiotus metropolitanus]